MRILGIRYHGQFGGKISLFHVRNVVLSRGWVPLGASAHPLHYVRQPDDPTAPEDDSAAQDESKRSKAMSVMTRPDSRQFQRNDFNNSDSAPTLREIRCTTAVVRENWSRTERQFRAQMAQLLQQQLLDRMASV